MNEDLESMMLPGKTGCQTDYGPVIKVKANHVKSTLQSPRTSSVLKGGFTILSKEPQLLLQVLHCDCPSDF
jgi:hypothetical protein